MSDNTSDKVCIRCSLKCEDNMEAIMFQILDENTVLCSDCMTEDERIKCQEELSDIFGWNKK